MNKKTYLSFVLLLCSIFFLKSTAQTTDLARIEYLNVPFSKGKNTVQRFRGLAQIPIPLDKEKNKLFVIGMEYRNLPLTFDKTLPFSTETIQRVHQIEGTLGYVWRFNDSNWRFAVKGGARIVSNLEHSLVSDDVLWLGAVYAINDMRKAENPRPYRWIFGLFYSTSPGRWYPLPLINYHREINETWNYTLGVPKTNIRYKFNKQHALQLFAELDHFFSNIQDNFSIPGTNKLAENISMTNVSIALGYEYFFTEHILYYAYAGYTVYNQYRIRDHNRDNVYVIEDNNSPYFRTGFKLKL